LEPLIADEVRNTPPADYTLYFQGKAAYIALLDPRIDNSDEFKTIQNHHE
jgi:hypothetical protein